MPLVELERSELQANGFDKVRKGQFFASLEESKGDVGKACDLIGIHIATYYRHLDHDTAFATQVRLIKSRLAHSLIQPLYKRAVEKSDTAAIWLQKCYDPRNFRPDSPSVAIAVKGDVKVVDLGPSIRPDLPDTPSE